MTDISSESGLGTLAVHAEEENNPEGAHVTPIYQTSTFEFPDLETGVAIFEGRQPGYAYTRLSNPNADRLARKIALLEGLDLLRSQDGEDDRLVFGKVFASGMAAISAAVLARVQAGETILAQRAVYGSTFSFFQQIAPRMGLQVVWVKSLAPEAWEAALEAHPGAALVYVETPVNPTLGILDLVAVADLARAYGAWLMVDNTFATPYCQRPLSLGADVVVHSTTKYLSGHGTVIGGAVVSRHQEYVRGDLQRMVKLLGGIPGPFDAWLAQQGLRTFELRMARHCENAGAVARFLREHPRVRTVYYPGLPDHPGHQVARRQMTAFGGMVSFELEGGLQAGRGVMDSVRLVVRAASLGTLDSLISHPASMSHRGVPPAEREKLGIGEGLVRLSVGVENAEDLIADLSQAIDRGTGP